MRLFSDVSERILDPWLRHAFALAEAGRGTTSPNPLVGCVVVRDGRIVGEGFHARAGMPHAEIVALEQAGAAAAGATVYVTLEPCTHHGRTPPCTDALVAARVARVMIGTRDPNTAVSGSGADVLRAAGIEATFTEDPAPFEIQNDAWFASLRSGRPFLRIKLGLSLDGHSALREGERASITGISGADVTRRLRSAADGVLVGAATVACDDPVLTVRAVDGVAEGRQPTRIVLAREHVPPTASRVFNDSTSRTILLAPASLVKQPSGALPELVEVVTYDALRGIEDALRAILSLGMVDVLVEPGPRLFSALWNARLIDELVVVHAGGVAGVAAPGLFVDEADVYEHQPAALSHRMTPIESGIAGDVAVTVWRPRAVAGEAVAETPAACGAGRQ